MRIQILILLLAVAAVADTVVLKNGLRVKGDVEERGDKIVVRLAGNTWSFEKDQVREIQAGATLQEEYAAKADALAAGDAAGWYRLGLWAREKRLAKARVAFERVIEIDAGHRAARRALGLEPRVTRQGFSRRVWHSTHEVTSGLTLRRANPMGSSHSEQYP